MHPSLSAALVLLLLAGGWLLGRRRTRPFLSSTDTAAVVALNRAQMERLHQRTSAAANAPESARPAWPRASAGIDPSLELAPLPTQPRMRRERLRQLEAWLAGSREQRLAAMTVASRSAGRDVLPLLRRGLRDPDPAVMAAAALVMQRFRGRCQPQLPSRVPVTRRR
jgi:hypothetical protein